VIDLGTRISDLQVTEVIDGDTIRVETDDGEESLRLACVDTEESRSGSGKPVTRAGKEASEMAKEYFATGGGGLDRVDMEFDTDDPVEVCLVKHRDNYGRLFCYVHKGEENFNLKLTREGWSPYFVKYGRSRLYDVQFMAAEAEAQAKRSVVWDPDYNGAGQRRDYYRLVPWWWLRASVVEDYRRLPPPPDVLSVRLDYQRLLESIDPRVIETVLCDLQEGVKRWPGGAVVYAGSPQHKFNLWIPDARNGEMEQLIELIEKRYSGQDEESYSGLGRGYVYVSGDVTDYEGKPQIVLRGVDQLSDMPPGS
jgi:micrococcal nuclease